MKFDAIAICGDCTEYGNIEALYNFEDLKNDYGYLYSIEE